PDLGHRHSAFCIDNRGGASVMVRHLASVGHRRIAFISGPSNNFDATERLAGYREALRALGLEEGERVLPGDFSEESGYRAAQSLLARAARSEEHTSELQSLAYRVCRLLPEKINKLAYKVC